jgi:hypothetical protein
MRTQVFIRQLGIRFDVSAEEPPVCPVLSFSRLDDEPGGAFVLSESDELTEACLPRLRFGAVGHSIHDEDRAFRPKLGPASNELLSALVSLVREVDAALTFQPGAADHGSQLSQSARRNEDGS